MILEKTGMSYLYAQYLGEMWNMVTFYPKTCSKWGMTVEKTGMSCLYAQYLGEMRNMVTFYAKTCRKWGMVYVKHLQTLRNIGMLSLYKQ